MDYYLLFYHAHLSTTSFVYWGCLLGLSHLLREEVGLVSWGRMIMLRRGSSFIFLLWFIATLGDDIGTIIILRKHSSSIIIEKHIRGLCWRLTQVGSLVNISSIIIVIIQTLSSDAFNCIMIHVMRLFNNWLFVATLLGCSNSFHQLLINEILFWVYSL